MTALRRTTTKNSAPIRDLRHEVICDQCHRSRARGNHDVCSKARQAMYARQREVTHEH
jgi:hypothetical protein